MRRSVARFRGTSIPSPALRGRRWRRSRRMRGVEVSTALTATLSRERARGQGRCCEPVSQAVDDLLEAEQRHQRAAQRNRRVEIGDRQHRRHPEAAEAGQEILPAVDDDKEPDRHDDGAVEHLEKAARPRTHRLRHRRELQVIAAPRRDRRPDEDAVDEESRRHFLWPQQWMSDHSRHHVEQRRRGETDEANAAEPHQHAFERVQRAPFQVTSFGENEVGAFVRHLSTRSNGRSAGSPPRAGRGSWRASPGAARRS